MGAKYTTQAVSGYNSSPPSDDGTQSAANQVNWSKIKTKLNDPLNTAVEAVNTALVSAFDYTINQVSAAYTTVAGDHMRTVEVASTASAAVTISLGDASTLTNGYRVFIKNSSAFNVTVSRATGGNTIDAVAGNVTLTPGQASLFAVNSSANGFLTLASWLLYLEGSYTGTLTGGTTAPTATINYTKIGNQVTISMVGGLTATSNSTGKTITGMPAAIRPSRTVALTPHGFRDNGAASATFGFVSLGSTGVIGLFPEAGGGAWTTSGTWSMVGDLTATYTQA